MPRVIHRFRPPPEHAVRNLYRFANGDWIPDDGEPDLAFSGERRSENGNWYPVAYGYQLRADAEEAPFWVLRFDEEWKFWGGHPNSVAMNAAREFTLSRFRVSNGHYVK